MKSIEGQSENIVEAQSISKKLTYLESFKDFISLHPNLISTFLEYEEKVKNEKNESGTISEESSVFESEGVRISVVQKPHKTKQTLGSYFKVETDKDIFFVKTLPGYHLAGLGANEMSSLIKAKKLLEGLEGVEVVDFQLGYEDRNGTTYFVSKWEDGVPLDNYFESLHKNGFEIKNSDIYRRYIDIVLRLGKFADVEEHNIFYNPQTDKLIVFDVHHRGGLW